MAPPSRCSLGQDVQKPCRLKADDDSPRREQNREPAKTEGPQSVTRVIIPADIDDAMGDPALGEPRSRRDTGPSESVHEQNRLSHRMTTPSQDVLNAGGGVTVRGLDGSPSVEALVLMFSPGYPGLPRENVQHEHGLVPGGDGC